MNLFLTPFANLKKPIAWFPTHYPLLHKLALSALLIGSTSMLPAQSNGWQPQSYKGEKTYKPVKKEIYKKGWIDFNKNGRKIPTKTPQPPLMPVLRTCWDR